MNGRHIEQTITAVCVLLFLGAVLFVAVSLFGCTEPPPMPALSPENAMAVKQYDDKLVECLQAARQKPKAQQFEAYADCEQTTMKFFCANSQDLQEKWARCKELAP